MILKPGPDAPPHFFLIGFRAPPGGTGADGRGEQVGVFVARSVIGFDGAPAEASEVRKEDEPYPMLPVDGPFRYEAEIAPWKPEPDVIIVDAAGDDNAPFGSVAIDRGAGFGAPAPRNFGWLSRTAAPRLPLAGREGTLTDPVSLAGFKADRFNLPDQFQNAFHNGRALAGAAPFAPGDRLRFNGLSGPVRIVDIPAAPQLSATQDGKPLDPQPVPAPRVDTVVMDRVANQFTLIWRATFPWEPRFESAVLEVN